MRRLLRTSAIGWLFLGLALTGCETKEVWLEFPDFGQGSIDGVWLWRLSEGGRYERACRIELGNAELDPRGEMVHYIQDCDDDHIGIELRAYVERSPANRADVTVRLWYMRWEDPGTYKVSAYGSDGETTLSDATLSL